MEIITDWFVSLTIFSQAVLVLFVGCNILTFFTFGWDKWKATLGTRRISERTLWILCLFGGSAGALLAMNFFRHKTKKISFQAVLAVILAAQIIALFFLLSPPFN